MDHIQKKFLNPKPYPEKWAAFPFQKKQSKKPEFNLESATRVPENAQLTSTERAPGSTKTSTRIN